MDSRSEAIFDDAELQEFLAKLKRRGLDFEQGSREFAGIISANVFRDVMAHFDQESGPEGAWQSWSKIYAEHMQMIGKEGNKILQDTGRLRQSFHPGNYRAEDGGIIFFNPAKVRGFPYAQAHNEGGGRLPQREFMWLSEIAMDEIAGAALTWWLEE